MAISGLASESPCASVTARDAISRRVLIRMSLNLDKTVQTERILSKRTQKLDQVVHPVTRRIQFLVLNLARTVHFAVPFG
jgi:hypothetical protein